MNKEENIDDETLLKNYDNMLEDYSKTLIVIEKIIKITEEKEKKIKDIEEEINKRKLTTEKKQNESLTY